MIINKWNKLKLGDAAEEVRKLFEPIRESIWPYIGLEHVEQYTLKLNGVGKSTDTISTKKSFDQGDILFGSLRPYFRKVVRPKFKGVCSTDITVIKAKPGFDVCFLYYLIASQNFIDHASNISSGTRMPRASWKVLSETEWSFPPAKTQRKIATILTSYDDLIENNLRRIKILEEMAQNLYREWFVNFRFPGHENARFVDSPLGSIPVGWHEAALNDMAQIITGYAFKSKDWVDNGIPVIKIRNIRPGNNVDTENADCITETLGKKINDRYLLQNGDYLIAMTGATAGKVGKLRSKVPMLLNQRVAKVKPKKIFSEYIWCSICSPGAEKAFYALADGAAQPNMSGEQIEKYRLTKPSEKVIIEFNNKVGPMLSLVDRLHFQNHNLRQTRDLLLPKLISGEVDVSDLDINLPEEALA